MGLGIRTPLAIVTPWIRVRIHVQSGRPSQAKKRILCQEGVDQFVAEALSVPVVPDVPRVGVIGVQARDLSIPGVQGLILDGRPLVAATRKNPAHRIDGTADIRRGALGAGQPENFMGRRAGLDPVGDEVLSKIPATRARSVAIDLIAVGINDPIGRDVAVAGHAPGIQTAHISNARASPESIRLA